MTNREIASNGFYLRWNIGNTKENQKWVNLITINHDNSTYLPKKIPKQKALVFFFFFVW